MAHVVSTAIQPISGFLFAVSELSTRHAPDGGTGLYQSSLTATMKADSQVVAIRSDSKSTIVRHCDAPECRNFTRMPGEATHYCGGSIWGTSIPAKPHEHNGLTLREDALELFRSRIQLGDPRIAPACVVQDANYSELPPGEPKYFTIGASATTFERSMQPVEVPDPAMNGHCPHCRRIKNVCDRCGHVWPGRCYSCSGDLEYERRIELPPEIGGLPWSKSHPDWIVADAWNGDDLFNVYCTIKAIGALLEAGVGTLRVVPIIVDVAGMPNEYRAKAEALSLRASKVPWAELDFRPVPDA